MGAYSNFPASISVVAQAGILPQPAQVCDLSAGFLYFGGIFLPASLLVVAFFRPRVFPNRYKHDLAQKLLLQQLKRNAMIVRPTRDDLEAARSDFEAEQKRVDLEYEKWAEDKLKWAEIRKRRNK